MKYILSIATALILVGAGCASTPATPSTESPTVLPPTQIEQPTTNTPNVTPTTTPTTNPTTTKPVLQPAPTTTKPVVTPPVVVTPPPTPTVKSYTMAEIAAANTEANCLTVINGIVYDLTSWISKHPGGDRNILRICGMDGTSAFSGQHGGESKPENTLATFDVGVLKK